ncbi:hypothetical protein NBG4_490007 [Candidatus Sulfobium mesophilum]|uniref:Uncharacterized protein n=1 Tax=Candidatus Sulfobium mesophilum TaxID=2016548 RepID=A0A2U3QIP3_9BACT|nr:hypothetical protein NBG4_490007 [Candidatus Sulfobium mesophilum]
MFTDETNMKQKIMSRLGNGKHNVSVQTVTKGGMPTQGDRKRVCLFILEVLEDCPARTSREAIYPGILFSVNRIYVFHLV